MSKTVTFKESYNFGTFLVLLYQFIFLVPVNDKGFIITSQNAAIDLNIPVFQWDANRLYLLPDAPLDGREDDPAGGIPERDGGGILPNVNARFLYRIIA